MGAKYTQAQNKATQKYLKNNFDTLSVRVAKGQKDVIKAHAEKQGESVNAYINRLIDEDMKAYEIIMNKKALVNAIAEKMDKEQIDKFFFGE